MFGAFCKLVANWLIEFPNCEKFILDNPLTLEFDNLVRLFIRFCKFLLLKFTLPKTVIPFANGVNVAAMLDKLEEFIFSNLLIPLANVDKFVDNVPNC